MSFIVKQGLFVQMLMLFTCCIYYIPYKIKIIALVCIHIIVCHSGETGYINDLTRAWTLFIEIVDRRLSWLYVIFSKL